MQAFPCDHKNYVLEEAVGRGAYSTVWRSKLIDKDRTAPGHPVAIKIIDLDNVLSSFEDILLEVQTMRLSNDPNILKFHCSFVQANQLWLVTQLMDMGSCLRVMSVAKSKGFGDGMNEEWLAWILRESLKGLVYLHSNGQIHRDMKAGNILLDAEGGVRLADFGVSGWTLAGGQRHEKVNTFVGTPCYMAPEVMEQAGGYDNRADIWSLGITALELAKGRAPYAHLSPMRVLVVTIEEDPPSLKSYPGSKGQRTGAPFSTSFDDFYKMCLQKNPAVRPPAQELLKHKFLQGRSPEALVNQLLNQIGVVGQSEQDEKTLNAGKLPGEGSILLEKLDDDGDSDSSLGGDLESRVNHDDSVAEGDLAGRSTTNVPSTAETGGYVAGTTWVFDSDNIGSSGELRRNRGSRSPRNSLRFSSISNRKALKSPVPTVPSSSMVISPSLDEFLNDFEREASTLPSLPKEIPAPPPVLPPAPPSSTTVETAASEANSDDSIEGWLDSIEKDCGSKERM